MGQGIVTQQPPVASCTHGDGTAYPRSLDVQSTVSPTELLLHHDEPQEFMHSGNQSRSRCEYDPLVSLDEEQPKEDGGDADTNGTASLIHSPLSGIGGLLQFIILVSLFILLVSICFLSWLWFEDNDRESWRRIILSGRSTQAITLTGILIRLSIGSLSTISTSMIASIAVETHGVPLPIVAEVSIARFTNNGPQSLFLLILGKIFTPSLRFWAIVLTISAVASQFTSTLLVADLLEKHVCSFPQKTHNSFDFQNFSTDAPPQLAASSNYWINRPSSSQIFAEYSKPGKFEGTLDDTGLTIRAFLPIRTQSERENIQNFRGMARVVDTRVVCVRPELTRLTCDGDDNAYRFCGRIKAEITQPNVFGPYYTVNDTIFANFDCPIVGGGDWVLCPLSYGLRGLPTVLDLVAGKASSGRQWLVIATSRQTHDNSTTLKLVNSTVSGPWFKQLMMYWDYNEMYSYGELDFTWCFDALDGVTQNLKIAASGPSNLTEPAFQWDFDSKSYITEAVRRQLGATSHKDRATNFKREILTISQEDMMKALDEARASVNSTQEIFSEALFADLGHDTTNWLLDLIDPGYNSLSICSGCSVNASLFRVVDVLLGKIFSDTLEQTDSPALALQALNTAVLRTAYYDQILAFAPSDEFAIITSFVPAQTPQSVLGFVVVMAIIACNLVVFMVICSLFIRVSKFSYIGNAWHTIAQVSKSTDAQALLGHAVFMPDKNAEERAGGRAPPEGLLNSIREYLKRLFCVGKKSDKKERLSIQDGVFRQATLKRC